MARKSGSSDTPAPRNVEGLLGTLRSELDQDDDGLHPDFGVLADLVLSVRSAYTAWKLTPEQAAGLLGEMVLLGDDGYQWTLGVTSGLWFRRPPGGVWQRALGPQGVSPVLTDRPEWLVSGVAAKVAALQGANRAVADVREDAAQGALPADVGLLPVSDLPPMPLPELQMSDDVDWIFDEWENPVAPAPLPPMPLPGDVPTQLTADGGFIASWTTDPTPPVDRDGAYGTASKLPPLPDLPDLPDVFEEEDDLSGDGEADRFFMPPS